MFPRTPYSSGSGGDLGATILVPSRETSNVEDGGHLSVASVFPAVQHQCGGVWFT